MRTMRICNPWYRRRRCGCARKTLAIIKFVKEDDESNFAAERTNERIAVVEIWKSRPISTHANLNGRKDAIVRYRASTGSCIVVALAAISFAALGQTAQPYSGMQSRPIKALSNQQVSDLKAGRGMGLALAAELNGYPGPSHLVELSDQLGLTTEQLWKLKGMFDAMKAETIPIGEKLIGQEEKLDRLFAENLISEQQLKAATESIGETQARLRNAHLRYHLQARAILQPSQIRRYAGLRGYGAETQDPAQHKHNHKSSSKMRRPDCVGCFEQEIVQ